MATKAHRCSRGWLLLLSLSCGCSRWPISNQLPCDELPELAAVEQIEATYANEIREIEAVAPGRITVMVNAVRCEGKGEFLIYHGTEAQKREIEERFVHGRKFHGIPVVLANV